MKKLKKNNIILRPLEPEDIEILYQWENDPEIWTISHTITPFSKYIIKKYIESSHLDIYQTKQFRFMIDVVSSTGKSMPIGTIDLFDFDPFHNRVGVGILIKEEENRQKGYASNALALLIEYTFSNLQVHQLYCNICNDNEASLHLFKKFNFEVIGFKKDWCKTKQGWKGEYLLQLLNPNQVK